MATDSDRWRARIARVPHRKGYRSELALALLAERYPDRYLPPGAYGAIAREVGVSPQAVHRLATSRGWLTARRLGALRRGQ